MKSNDLIKLEETIKNIAPDGRFALAYSGGVDSSILLEVARRMGIDVLPLTFSLEESLKLPEVRANGRDRCYHCKKLMMSTFRKEAGEKGYKVLCDGTNVDDRKQYRPGLKALEEEGVRSPIAEAGLTKEQLREIGRELGLEIANKPSSPCHLTRFPYDTYVTDEMLEAVRAAEDLMKSAGFPACRVRVFKDTSKIEVPLDVVLLIKGETDLLNKVLDVLKPIFVSEVIVDEKGLRSGTMDENGDV
jgi:uncharacterized protein